jgi:hypothetical protein
MMYLNSGLTEQQISEAILNNIKLPSFQVAYRGDDSEYPTYSYIDISSVSKETIHAALVTYKTNTGYELMIKFWFGEKFKQAKAFYKNTSVANLKQLQSKNWDIGANLNLSHIKGRKHIWIHSKQNQHFNYFDYWRNNIYKELHKRDIPSGHQFLNNLDRVEKIIDYTPNRQTDYQNVFFNSNRSFVIVNPGFQASYIINESETSNQDNKNNLDHFVKYKMEDCFQVLFGRAANFI